MRGRYALSGPITPAWILPALLLYLLAGCGRFAESCFDLSPGSRLPAWFSLPTTAYRDSVTVYMCYYNNDGQRTATFVLRNIGNGAVLAKADCVLRGLYPLTAKNTEPAPSEYPAFEVITVSGITEVIEHRRMEPIFYVVDDSSIRHDLGVER